ncbi:DoxX family protein [Dysgonomonas sp. Marseille-P4677]|uniref:DoxX family protein n=1 Tax=Dysgonomonas sp. Marseille-P4677 TaxID=2364790 RepID=UPI001913A332|nr:DoxX family protein [Dysgonomonas sp. Marseille-P4677]MBK5720566.1 DoxX family protein [Dysgonomonas sp. Marseille-P4677]
MKVLDRNIDLGLLILRLSVGVLMLLHGISKLIYGVGFIEQTVIDAGLPSFVAYGVYVGELIMPLFIILGYATRIASAIFAFNMIVAVGLAHVADIFTLNAVGGWAIELQGLYFFAAVALVFTGGGKYALSSKHLWD